MTDLVRVDKRLRDLIAQEGGSITLTAAKNRMDYRYRAVLPVVLASGDYAVTDEPGGVRVRLVDDTAH